MPWKKTSFSRWCWRPRSPPLRRTGATGSYVIGPQDVLGIQVFDQADLGGKYTVEADGTFSFPLVGRVSAGGLTLRKFETELRRQLADGYFKNPQVTVAVVEYRSQRLFVLGEVRTPGPVALTGT
jgi:polysaccharide export outer membrane protein